MHVKNKSLGFTSQNSTSFKPKLQRWSNSLRILVTNELNQLRFHFRRYTDGTIVFVEPNCCALCFHYWLRVGGKTKKNIVLRVSENKLVRKYKFKSTMKENIQTSWFGSLKIKCSKNKRAAEEPDILTFTTNLSPLWLCVKLHEN